MIAFNIIATGGERYTKYLKPLYDSLKKFMPENEVLVYSDVDDFRSLATGVFAHAICQPDLGWPRATLMRYHAILRQKELLKNYSHVFYIDIDMLVCQPITEREICGDGMTAVIHPGFPDAFERNPQSTAYISPEKHPTYFQGCFVGGKTDAFLSFCETVTSRIDIDNKNRVMAMWHDESHLNRYFLNQPPAIQLSPAYAYPAVHYLKNPRSWGCYNPETFVPKIRHLEKLDQGTWKR